MKGILGMSVIWLITTLASIYLGGYIYLKYKCNSSAMTPSDPWKGSELSMHSRVYRWGHGDLRKMSFNLCYRDPGLDLEVKFAEFLNAVFVPLRKMDEEVSGWSVKFRTRRTEQVGDGEPNPVGS